MSVVLAALPAFAAHADGADATTSDKKTDAAPAKIADAKPTKVADAKPSNVAVTEGTSTQGTATFGTNGYTPPMENAWVGWDTGGKEAGLGLGIFGHVGVGHRFNHSPLVDQAGGSSLTENGFLIGIDALVRFNRYIGVGIGYEHEGLGQDQQDLVNNSFTQISRNLNALWFQGRVYPLRIDPFALYIDFALGPEWQNADSSQSTVDLMGGVNTANACSGSGPAGLGLRGAVGGELALISGLTFFGELGPDGYLQSEQNLTGSNGVCAPGAGGAVNIAFRAGFAFGMEKTRRAAAPGDTDHDGIPDDKDACPTEPGPASSDPKKNGCPLPKDTDGDGIPDDVDACPTIKGVPNADPTKNGCPPVADRDHDGIPDPEDACPDDAGPKNDDPTLNGCPDKDGDGVPDKVDACPDVPGVKTTNPKTNGCPADRDGDGIPDDKDACPDDPGPPNDDPKKNGCPLVIVKDNEVVINEQVQFDTAKSTIKPVSDPLLDAVAKVLKDHTEIKKVEVQGHTDNQGSKGLNKQLSNDRAASVLKALAKRGVDAKRMVSKGYGDERPIAPNDTDAGRQQNRRVQFIVLEKSGDAPKPPAPQPPAPQPAAPAPKPTAQPAAPAQPATPAQPAAPAQPAPAPKSTTPAPAPAPAP